MVKELTHNYKIGDIFYQRGRGWGYYLVDFWQIVRVSNKNVWMAHIKFEVVDEHQNGPYGLTYREVRPLPNKFTKSKKAWQLLDDYYSNEPIPETTIRRKIKNGSTDNRIESTERIYFSDDHFSYFDVDYERYIGETITQCNDYHLMR
ncbi:hypothetical protein [Bacillus cereus]|uniref:hypothetical protein n=1 Tax=Bacillus cereus TaxID=1396 RepID=UPI0008188B4A|nr:hypothetical protein [Bacillus cereus]